MYAVAMSEHIPNFPEGREGIISKEGVIASLKENPTELAPLHQYLNIREAEVTTTKEGLALNVEVAEIYLEAGLLEAARDAFEDAIEQAFYEGDDVLRKELEARCDAIK